MKAHGLTAQEMRELVDAVAFIEAHTGERLEPQEVGDVLGFFCDDGAGGEYLGDQTELTRKLNAAGAIIALALGDDRPEFHAMIEKGGN